MNPSKEADLIKDHSLKISIFFIPFLSKIDFALMPLNGISLIIYLSNWFIHLFVLNNSSSLGSFFTEQKLLDPKSGKTPRWFIDLISLTNQNASAKYIRHDFQQL